MLSVFPVVILCFGVASLACCIVFLFGKRPKWDGTPVEEVLRWTDSEDSDVEYEGEKEMGRWHPSATVERMLAPGHPTEKTRSRQDTGVMPNSNQPSSEERKESSQRRTSFEPKKFQLSDVLDQDHFGHQDGSSVMRKQRREGRRNTNQDRDQISTFAEQMEEAQLRSSRSLHRDSGGSYTTTPRRITRRPSSPSFQAPWKETGEPLPDERIKNCLNCCCCGFGRYVHTSWRDNALRVMKKEIPFEFHEISRAVKIYWNLPMEDESLFEQLRRAARKFRQVRLCRGDDMGRHYVNLITFLKALDKKRDKQHKRVHNHTYIHGDNERDELEAHYVRGDQMDILFKLYLDGVKEINALFQKQSLSDTSTPQELDDMEGAFRRFVSDSLEAIKTKSWRKKLELLIPKHRKMLLRGGLARTANCDHRESFRDEQSLSSSLKLVLKKKEKLQLGVDNRS